MRYQYTLCDGVIDEIVEDHLDSQKFNRFINSLTKLNEGYQYSVYLYGSYLDYIINREPYSEISFIITNQQVLVIDELTLFLKNFHRICKKHNIIYRICYAVSLDNDHINKDSSSVSLFTIPETRIISYHSQIIPDAFNLKPLTPMSNTTLFEGVMDANMVNSVIGGLKKNRKTFPVPIKIL